MKSLETYGTKEAGKAHPRLKWQRGHYALSQEITFLLPYSFILLCKLWGITPRDVLIDFMDNMAHASWKRKGRDTPKQHLREYAKAMAYAKQHYTPADVEQMFIELDAIGLLWPEAAKTNMKERHARWRDEYYNWWYKKWWKKYDRKPMI